MLWREFLWFQTAKTVGFNVINVLKRNAGAAVKCDLAIDGIYFEDIAGNTAVSAAGFAVIPAKISDRNHGLLGKDLCQQEDLFVEGMDGILVQLNLRISEPGGFLDHRIVASESGKRRKLSTSVDHAHSGITGGDRVG